MYTYEVKHKRPGYRNGDRESETVIHEACNYKLLSDAKKQAAAFLKEQQGWNPAYKQKIYAGKQMKAWFGDDCSYAAIFETGDTWINEGTGDEERETFVITIKKD